jgi:hypothetical protein
MVALDGFSLHKGLGIFTILFKFSIRIELVQTTGDLEWILTNLTVG